MIIELEFLERQIENGTITVKDKAGHIRVLPDYLLISPLHKAKSGGQIMASISDKKIAELGITK